MKEESENVGLKLNTQKIEIMASGPITSWQIDEETIKSQHSKTKIMASGPITSWQTDGEKLQTVTDFFFFLGGVAPKSLQTVITATK